HRMKYVPQPVKHFWISKPDGSKRPLGILTIRDRIVKRAVFQVIEPLFDNVFEDCSYAFRKGRSVDTAITQTSHLVGKGNHWVVHVDIERFFENIDVTLLYTFITEKIKDKKIRMLIKAWLYSKQVTFARSGFWGIRKKKGILQGDALSPLYANIYLDRFDKNAIKMGLHVVRFADNILVVTQSKKKAEKSLKSIRRILRNLKLKLNKSKTLVTHLENRFTFLGKGLVLVRHGKKAWLSVKDKSTQKSQQEKIFRLHDHKQENSPVYSTSL
ncbi:MAG: reverse transcriptase/maturase family protein, partial [Candidatus Scalindua sp.]|nr:reverse transcriptase/maturase family protein [Candidatus Scalindua sp.]MCR4344888.1 reverse transcriptase/maturase family protein [Candidatus Scalindua sp.]